MSLAVYLVQSILQAILVSRTSLEVAVAVMVEQHVARLRTVVGGCGRRLHVRCALHLI